MINFCTLISYVTTILVIYNELYVMNISVYRKALIVFDTNLGFYIISGKYPKGRNMAGFITE